MDGMPFVTGQLFCRSLYVATGFNAWGITNGTAAGMILGDLISGRDNPWAAAFDATRVKPLAGVKSFIGENVGTGRRWSEATQGERRSLDELPSGRGGDPQAGGARRRLPR